jgi:hypothetical protein
MPFTVPHSAGKESNDYATIMHYIIEFLPNTKAAAYLIKFLSTCLNNNTIKTTSRLLCSRDIINCTLKGFASYNLVLTALE